MAATSAEVVVAVKDAEINMLRQQLAQISSDLSRNLAVSVLCTTCRTSAYALLLCIISWFVDILEMPNATTCMSWQLDCR